MWLRNGKIKGCSDLGGERERETRDEERENRQHQCGDSEGQVKCKQKVSQGPRKVLQYKCPMTSLERERNVGKLLGGRGGGGDQTEDFWVGR